MRWSVKIARVLGIEVRLHVTFLLFLAWIAFSHYQLGGAEAAWHGVLFLLALFGCVLLHEFGHALAARMFGIHTPDITLLPIGGVARLQRMPDHPWQELVVAIAGPLVNVVIAFVLVFVLQSGTGLEDFDRLHEPGVGMLTKLASVNIVLVLFNLIPAFPMDGGRVLRALLAMVMSYSRATSIAAIIGQGLAFVFGFLGLVWNPLLLFIALFVFLGAQGEAAMAQIKDLSRGLRVSDAMITEFVTLDDHATLADAVEALLRTSQHEFPITDVSGELRGILTRDDMIKAYRRSGPDTPVIEVMRTRVPKVPAWAPFEEAFRLMQECECPAVAVTDGWGRLVGLITPENIGEMMMIQTVLPRGGTPAWRLVRS
ncbi:MAG: site-2 protease family protein [Verrucomicrobiae bacterium]|nr:site-2 protease family protein [Verrucomicrobiae bacterium]